MVTGAAAPTVVLDIAGGMMGGAAHWCAELDAYLRTAPAEVQVIGRDRALTPTWLLRRERLARRAQVVVAPNNVSFVVSGGHRRVVIRNALHFLHPSERHLLDRMPRRWRAQIPVVRNALARADEVVVPSSAMAERVLRRVPQVRDRLVVRHHPVTPPGARQPAGRPFVLAPVLLAPYKNLLPQLRMLAAASDLAGLDTQVLITADPAEVPADLVSDPRFVLVGRLPVERLAVLWRTAAAIFYPSTVEAFGYPLAEARACGIPVLAPDTAQTREIASGALRGYDPADVLSLADALSRIGDPVVPDHRPFDRDAYFRWLLGVAARER